MIVNLINSMLRLGYFPSCWKNAKIKCILKPGKNPCLVNSYRPIILLAQLSKIVEKIIKSRFEAINNSRDSIAMEQFGFKTGHNTTDQLASAVSNITRNFNGKKHHGMALLDVSKAFDYANLIIFYQWLNKNPERVRERYY